MALRVVARLKKFFRGLEFIRFDPTEEIELPAHFIAIDTVVGLPEVQLFNDIKSFTDTPRATVHDFDLFTFLGLMCKLKKIRKLSLIGIPEKGSVDRFVKNAQAILSGAALFTFYCHSISP